MLFVVHVLSILNKPAVSEQYQQLHARIACETVDNRPQLVEARDSLRSVAKKNGDLMALLQLSPDSPVMAGRYTIDEEDIDNKSFTLSARMFPRRILPLSVQHKTRPDLCESFDYFDSENGTRISGGVLWLITFFSAVVIGLVKGCVTWMSVLLWDARIENMTSVAEEYNGSILPAMGVYASYAAVSGLFASILTITVSLAGGGGGISDIKMYLNGNVLQGFLGKRALFVRIFGVALVTSCGVMLGPEGPMAHVGTLISVLIARLCLSNLTDRQTYDFATVGSGLGIASAFNAPLAGTLFALEEAASFWHPDLVSRTFFGALVTAVVGQYTSAGFVCENSTYCVSVSGEFGFTESAYLTEFFSPWEMPFFIILGAMLGVVAIGFSIIFMYLFHIRQKQKFQTWKKITDAVIVFTITAIFFSLLTYIVPCIDSSSVLPSDTSLISSAICSNPKSVNPISLILLERRNYAIQSFFSSETDSELYSSTVLIVSAIAVFLTAAVTAGLALPAGLFIPMVLCGATLGRLFGNWISLIPSTSVHPGVYALAGASAFLAGTSRMTVWIALVMIESSDNLHLTVPVMIAIVSAKFVADLIQPHGMYEQLILARNVKFLPNEEYIPDSAVRTIMSAPVVCFFQIEQTALVTAILSLCSHSTFPIIDSEEHVIGISKRDELMKRLSANDKEGIFLLPISFIPISLNSQFPSSKCYYIFSQLGVRVVTIVDAANRILGIVTRENFI